MTVNEPIEKSEEPKEEFRLSDFDVALLILIDAQGAAGLTAYDIVQMIKEGRAGLLGRSAASVYSRLPVLAERGFLSADRVEGKRGKGATRYWAEPAGDRAAHEWLRTHRAKLPALDDSEAFVFLRGAWIEEPKFVWKGLIPMVYEIEDKLAELDRYERECRLQERWFAHPESLEVKLERLLLRAYKSWLDEVRREFKMPDPLADESY